MAAVTCTRTDLFPNGTVVKAYPRAAFHSAGEALPTASSVAEATMTSGTCTLEGLTAGQEYTLAGEVGGFVRVLGVQAPASTAVVAATGLPEPSLQSLIAASFDPVYASGTYKLATAGVLYKARVPVKSESKLSNILLWLATKGATLTASQCFAGVFAEGTRSLLAQVTAAETIAKMEGANGSLQTLPLEKPVVVGPGYVDVGVFYNGTTAPTFGAGAAQGVTGAAALINAGSSGKGLRFAEANTGLTTALPNPMSETQTAVAAPIWVGLS
jgi:hypothetical protein